MAPPADVAKAYKEQLLEWAVRSLHHGFVDNISARSMYHYASFEPSKLGGENGAYFMHEGAGLMDAMNETIQDQSRIEGLKISLAPMLNRFDKSYEAVRIEIHRLLEEDIKNCDRPHCCAQYRDQIGCLNLKFKLSLVARHRMTQNLKLLEPADTSTEYQVLVFTLVLGHGTCQRSTKLFLDHRSPFPAFLDALREATISSQIPPRNVTEEIAFWTAIDDGEFDIKHSAFQLSSKDLAKTGTCSASPSRHTQSFQKSPRLENLDEEASSSFESKSSSLEEQGYTLDHGPWTYRFARNCKELKLTAWEDIADEDGYMKMLEELRELDTKFSSHVVILMHSMDREAERQQSKLNALNQAERDRNAKYYDSLRWPQEDSAGHEVMSDCTGPRKDDEDGSKRDNQGPSLSFRSRNSSFTSFGGIGHG